ncbi:poly(A)-binding protein binding protein [Cystobasidiomycetes sp. EMM_F5]
MMQRHAAQQSLRVLRCTAGAGLRCRARSASVSSRASYATNQTGRSLGFLLLGGSFAATLALASYTVQASDESLATLLRLPVARAEEPKDLPISAHIQLDQTPVHLDPDTKIMFPSTLKEENMDEVELIGLGVRVVSFLRVQVYSVGVYFTQEALSQLRVISAADLQSNCEAYISKLLDSGDAIVRIVPVKNTDFGHLRDGFVRAMLARLNFATKSQAISEAQAETAALAIDTFKSFFPTGKVPRGNSLLLGRRAKDGALLVVYEVEHCGRLLGTLSDTFLSKQLLLAYFADNGKEISPKAGILSSPDEYPNMLAAKRSIGSLRAAARAQASTVPPVPSTPSRSLVSAVLLSSQKGQLERQTVKQLQSELRGRGLSSVGKKKDLVDRLLEAVSRGPAATPSPRSSTVTSQNPTTAAFSTTSRSVAPAPSSIKATSSADTANADVSPAVAAETVPVFSPSPVIAGSQPPTAGEAAPKDAVLAGPGLVVDKSTADQAAEQAEAVPGGGIDMPAMTASQPTNINLPSTEIAADNAEIMIPSLPDQYTNSADHDPFVQPFTMHPSWLTPKVHSVSQGEQEVHHPGSAQKVEEDPEAVTNEPKKEFVYLNDAGLLEDMFTSLGIRLKTKAKSAAKQAFKQGSSVLSMLESETGVKIPPLSEPIGQSQSGSGKSDFKFHDRPLNSEESRGLYVLTGIVGTGLLAGTLSSRAGKKDKSKRKDKSSH